MSEQKALHVLLVDDDAFLIEMLTDFFHEQEITTTVAGDGKEALTVLESITPDAVVLDVVLPHVDGITVLSRLRDSGCQIPVVLLSKKKSVDDLLQGFGVGADDYITKPFSPRELLNRVHAVVQRNRTNHHALTHNKQ